MRAHLPALLAVLSLTSLPAAAQTHADVLIRHATLVDVEHARLIADQAVASSADTIVAVGRDSEIAKAWTADKTIDATGGYLIPGLWDMHVHFGGGPDLIEENKALLPLYVAHGITTIRDASGDLPYDVLAWRGEIARGALFGPTLLSSGPKIEGIKPVWKGTLETGSQADVDGAVAKLKALDVDFVKITDSTLKPELFLYAVRQARAAGLRTSGHIPKALTVRQAIDAGLSSIEHLDYAFRAGVRDGTFDRATAMQAYAYFARKKIAVTPTLNGSRIIAWLDSEKHEKDEYLAYIGPKLRKTYEWRVQRAAQADAAAVAERHAHFDQVAAVLPMLQQAGVGIMAGTDAGFLNSFNYPGIGLHDELALFVEKGLTPQQALVSATRAGPAWFGKLDRYGAISKGKAADMVLLERNPLADISATRAIRAVVLRGKVHDRAALDGMLSETRARVTAWNFAQDVDVLQQAFETLHPGLLRYNSQEQMRRSFDELRDTLSRDQSLPHAYLAFSQFAAKIKCGHTYPNFYNQPKAIRAALFERTDRVPFEFRWLDGRMVVTRNLSTDASLTPGSEVLSLEGVPAGEILAKLMTIARADGNNDAKRVALLEVQGQERYETFDIYLPLLFPQVDETHTLTIRNPGSTTIRELTVPALTYAQRLAARREADTGDQPAWSLQFPQRKLAVLRMPTWALYDSKWDWKTFLKEAFTALAQRKTSALVIDLRGNEGGLDIGNELLAYLAREPIAASGMRELVRYRKVPDDLVAYLDTWDPTFKDWGEQAVPFDDRYLLLKRKDDDAARDVQPKTPRFAGKVFVLIGAGNSSATFEFAQQIRKTRLGTLVGQTTGGNQRGINGGAFFFLRLPNSRIEIDLPLIGQFPAGDVPDAGIEPDVQVHPTLEDMAAGRDPEMAAVLSR